MGRFGFDVVDADGHVVETRQRLAAYGWSSTGTELINALLSWERRADWGDRLRPELPPERDTCRGTGAPLLPARDHRGADSDNEQRPDR